jgi:hypothetical protein
MGEYVGRQVTYLFSSFVTKRLSWIVFLLKLSESEKHVFCLGSSWEIQADWSHFWLRYSLAPCWGWVTRMETSIPPLEPDPTQPNYPGDGHPVCLHNTFLDSESPLCSLLVWLWIKSHSILGLVTLYRHVCSTSFPCTVPSWSRGTQANKRVGTTRHWCFINLSFPALPNSHRLLCKIVKQV